MKDVLMEWQGGKTKEKHKYTRTIYVFINIVKKHMNTGESLIRNLKDKLKYSQNKKKKDNEWKIIKESTTDMEDS